MKDQGSKRTTEQTTYKVLGHNILTDKWDDLGTITAKSKIGANQKAHRLHGYTYDEFGFWPIENA